MVINVLRGQDYNVTVANQIAETITATTHTNTKKKVYIALSGGSTPLPILAALKEQDLNWEQLLFFMVDERTVPIKHPDSNFGALSKVFFDHIPSKSFSMVKDGMSTQEAVMTYESTMKESMETNRDGFPIFDLILLGMGNDGHTASLFPETKALSENTKWVVINEVPQLNTSRITLTYPVILSAKEVIVLIKGDEKKQIYEELISDKDTTYPMQKVVNGRNDLRWILGESI